jgi:transaldolase
VEAVKTTFPVTAIFRKTKAIAKIANSKLIAQIIEMKDIVGVTTHPSLFSKMKCVG